LPKGGAACRSEVRALVLPRRLASESDDYAILDVGNCFGSYAGRVASRPAPGFNPRATKKIVDGNREIGKLNADKDKLNADKDKLKCESSDLKRQLGGANRNLEAEYNVVLSVAQRNQSTKIKEEFLEKYLSCEITEGDEARKLFADYVCVLWEKFIGT
jgi:hypothetical protein